MFYSFRIEEDLINSLLAGAERKESLMIGDNLIADCVGAREQGIDQVFFNPKRIKHTEKVTHEIEDLEELLGIV